MKIRFSDTIKPAPKYSNVLGSKKITAAECSEFERSVIVSLIARPAGRNNSEGFPLNTPSIYRAKGASAIEAIVAFIKRGIASAAPSQEKKIALYTSALNEIDDNIEVENAHGACYLVKDGEISPIFGVSSLFEAAKYVAPEDVCMLVVKHEDVEVFICDSYPLHSVSGYRLLAAPRAIVFSDSEEYKGRALVAQFSDIVSDSIKKARFSTEEECYIAE